VGHAEDFAYGGGGYGGENQQPTSGICSPQRRRFLKDILSVSLGSISAKDFPALMRCFGAGLDWCCVR
jgi:hypothetical protein